jgi:DNA repair protein RecO (recombination protein O)
MPYQADVWTDAFVLHARPWRDTSLLLDVLSREYGLMRVLARSARGPKSRFRGYLQPFTALRMLCGGKGTLAYLNKVEHAAFSEVFKASSYRAACYVNELLLRMLKPDAPCPFIYTAYQDLLVTLGDEARVASVLRVFELTLLRALGYGLNCMEASDGQRIDAKQFYTYRHETGFVLQPDAPYSGAMIQALASGRLSGVEQVRQSKHLLRFILLHYLEGKPLKSWAVWA